MLSIIKKHSTGIIAGLLLGGLLTATAKVSTTRNKVESNITESTVMITNLEGNSGGSGSVINILSNESEILTNAHVCRILLNGGLVTTTEGARYNVSSYKQDTIHDLCIVVIPTKLKSKASIAPNPGKIYEKAITSGHPSLLPNILTEGHFSENKMITIFMGVKECTKDDWKENPEVCFFFGGMPIVRNFMATVLSTLIMPGSSGSAVYNEKQQLTNVVFAGQGDLSFGFAVPNEYINLFVSKYANNKGREEFSKPDPMNKPNAEEQINSKKIKEVVIKCLSTPKDKVSLEIQRVCNIVARSMVW